MKKGQILEGIVTELDFPNKGIVYEEGKKVVVKNVIPGQKIRYAVKRARTGKCEGRLLDVIERSAMETAANPCPHFSECGGCSYQTLPYERQLELKSTQVKKLLSEVCPDINFEEIKPSPLTSAYRNKMEYTFGDEYKDGPLALGLHKRGSMYDIVNVNECCLVHEDFNAILACTLEYFSKRGIPFYRKMQHTGYLRHLLIRRAVITGEILAVLVTTSDSIYAAPETGCTFDEEELLAGWRDAVAALNLKGSLAGLLHTVNDSLADVVQSDRTDILYGCDYFYEEILGLKFKITPFSFFQTNSRGAEVLYSTAREYIGDTKDSIVFDLYSGTGTIGQLMAPVAKKVIGVEIVEEAVEAAKANAVLNGLNNCEFIAGDVLKMLDTIDERPDYIILDPPRDGIHPKALTKIIDYGVDRIVYISCKPTSLARDLEVFIASGYEVERACAVDMFPGTGHVETVVLLDRIK